MESQITRKKIWIDCDPGIDDIFGIYMGLFHPALELIGLSVVHGNLRVEQCLTNALGALQLIGQNKLTVIQGSARPIKETRPNVFAPEIHTDSYFETQELNYDQAYRGEDYLDQMYEEIKAHKNVNFVCTGAGTNLVLLIKKYPQVKKHIEQVSCMGGAEGIGNKTPAAEFNILIDPQSYEFLLHEEGLKVTLVPIDVTHTCLATEEIQSRIKAINSPYANQMCDLLQKYETVYRSVYNIPFPPIHDPVAVYYIAQPDAFKSKFTNVVVQCDSQYCQGRTVVDIYQRTSRKPNAYWTQSVDVKNFWDNMIQCLQKANAKYQAFVKN